MPTNMRKAFMDWLRRYSRRGHGSENRCEKCDQTFEGDGSSHLRRSCPERRWYCKRCGKESTYKDITGNHDKDCDGKKVKCTLCGKYNERGTMEEHVNKCCGSKKVNCPECNKEVERKKINRHIQTVHRDADIFKPSVSSSTTARARTGVSPSTVSGKERLRRPPSNSVAPWEFRSRENGNQLKPTSSSQSE